VGIQILHRSEGTAAYEGSVNYVVFDTSPPYTVVYLFHIKCLPRSITSSNGEEACSTAIYCGYIYTREKENAGHAEIYTMPRVKDQSKKLWQMIYSSSTKRPASHAFFAAFCNASRSPLISHIPLNTAFSPSFLSNSCGCPYSTTSPLSKTSTLS
jgi:hypothetical protein